jgi:hypothetical protein
MKSNSPFTESAPENSQNEGPAASPQSSISSRRRLGRFLIYILIAILIAAVAGYFSGSQIGETSRDEAEQIVTTDQFDLALDDIANGRFEIARQRLEYISRIDPGYPGLPEQLAKTLLALNAPTATPVPEVTPTPNLAPIEGLLESAHAAFESAEWTLTIDTLLLLRSKDPLFHAVEVDGLLFGALRNRGVDKISQEGLLEEGLYDLSRAEQFGPLDQTAKNWINWASLYITANSYMGIHWENASFYFSQLYPVAPYMKNDTYLKYARATGEFAIELFHERLWCEASEQYKISLSIVENPSMVGNAAQALERCAGLNAPVPDPEETTAPDPTATPEEGG